MADSERRELNLPADAFEFTDEGGLVVRHDRLTNAFRETGAADARTDGGEVSVGVVVSRSF